MTAPARPYDFRQPRLLSQEQMRLFGRLHDTFGRDVSVYLSSLLRTIVDLRPEQVEQGSYAAFLAGTSRPAALYVVDAAPLRPSFVLEVDPCLAAFLVDKLFGGAGLLPEEARPLTQVERGIMSKVTSRLLGELEKAWKPFAARTFTEAGFETNAEFVQIASGTDAVFTVRYAVKVYEQTSFLRLCYPYRLLEQLLVPSGYRAPLASPPQPPEEQARHRQVVEGVQVELCAELGRARLPIGELMRLQVGDVIPLAQRVHEPLAVRVDQHARFKAAGGRSGRHHALRIVDVLANQAFETDERA